MTLEVGPLEGDYTMRTKHSRMRLVTLYQRFPRAPHFLPHVKTQREASTLKPGKEFPPGLDMLAP